MQASRRGFLRDLGLFSVAAVVPAKMVEQIAPPISSHGLFLGTPTAPTPSVLDNSQRIATFGGHVDMVVYDSSSTIPVVTVNSRGVVTSVSSTKTGEIQWAS